MRARWRGKIYEWKPGDNYGDKWADEVAALETANAALLEALEIALASVEWMAGATDADPADHERLATVQAVIRKAKENER